MIFSIRSNDSLWTLPHLTEIRGEKAGSSKRAAAISFPEEIDLLLKEFKMNRRNKVPYELKDPVLHDMALFSPHTEPTPAGSGFQERSHRPGGHERHHTRNVFMTGSLRAASERRRPENPGNCVYKTGNAGMIIEISNSSRRVVDRSGFNRDVTGRRHKATSQPFDHTFFSRLAIQGETSRTIAEPAGHKTLRMVKQNSHPSEGHRRSAALNLEKRFRGKKATGEKKIVPVVKSSDDPPPLEHPFRPEKKRGLFSIKCL
jgi:hypothetical protein